MCIRDRIINNIYISIQRKTLMNFAILSVLLLKSPNRRLILSGSQVNHARRRIVGFGIIGKAAHLPVSYTHLDVYKRQDALFEPFFGIILPDGFCTGKPLLPFGSEGDVLARFDFVTGLMHQF